MQDFIPAKLVLANQQVFYGVAPVWQQDAVQGEVVFNTGMTGYEETLTDPSYCDQILTFTYPILGNYGVGKGENFESEKIHVNGIICQSIFKHAFHYQHSLTFLEWLFQVRIPLIMGIDTRELTKTIRDFGVIEGVMIFGEKDSIAPEVSNCRTDQVARVSSKEVQHYKGQLGANSLGTNPYKVLLVDCGYKKSILTNLLQFNVEVTIVPYDYDYSCAMYEEYDGIFLSNGPGDPKSCMQTINILKKALNAPVLKPIFGICLGAQLMALAIGADTYKLRFGHRGQNQPCINTETQSCYLTSQNHGYAVVEGSLPHDWRVDYRHLNDGTVAGITHQTKPFRSVQFHPEAAAGPHDTRFFFNEFFQAMAQYTK